MLSRLTVTFPSLRRCLAFFMLFYSSTSSGFDCTVCVAHCCSPGIVYVVNANLTIWLRANERLPNTKSLAFENQATLRRVQAINDLLITPLRPYKTQDRLCILNNTGANSTLLSTLHGIVTNSPHGCNSLTTRSSLTWSRDEERNNLGRYWWFGVTGILKRCVDIRVPEVPLG